jgi:hypothetical protein
MNMAYNAIYMEDDMGEYNAVIEKLNKILVENGFANVDAGILSPGNGTWYSCATVPLQFDGKGRYIKPENGEYGN